MPNMRIDDAPAPGSVFVYPASGSESAHTGIVVGVTASGLYTVEGNSGDALKCYGCPDNGIVVVGNSALRSLRQMQLRSTVYLHTEEIAGSSFTQAGTGWISSIVLLSALLGTWYYNS